MIFILIEHEDQSTHKARYFFNLPQALDALMDCYYPSQLVYYYNGILYE